MVDVPNKINPHTDSTVYGSYFLGELFEGLFTLNLKGEFILGAASTWQVSDDGCLVSHIHLGRIDD